MEQVVKPLWTERETEMTQIHERSTERISVGSFQLKKRGKKAGYGCRRRKVVQGKLIE